MLRMMEASSASRVEKLCTAGHLRGACECLAQGFGERLAGATGSRVAWRPGLRRRTSAAPGLGHVPFDVVGEHAQEDVGAHPVGEAVMDGADADVDGLRVRKARSTPVRLF